MSMVENVSLLCKYLRKKNPEKKVNYRQTLTFSLFSCSALYISNSQIKNAQNKTSTTIASPDSVSSPKPSEISSNAVPTQKPITTTYKSFTSSYKSTPSTKATTLGYNNYTELDRQRLRDEFFATYDVMTGIRIAATLGGFFFLMVFLIVYKSRSHSNRALRVSFSALQTRLLNSFDWMSISGSKNSS